MCECPLVELQIQGCNAVSVLVVKLGPPLHPLVQGKGRVPTLGQAELLPHMEEFSGERGSGDGQTDVYSGDDADADL